MSHYQRPIYNYPLYESSSSAGPYESWPDDNNVRYYASSEATPRHADYSMTINPRVVEQRPSVSNNYVASSRTMRIPSESSLDEDEDYPTAQRISSSSQRRTSTSRNQTYFDPERQILISKSDSPRYYCPEPGCVDEAGRPKSLGRRADLKRHQESVHAKPFIDCKYSKCEKKGQNGFRRKDHYMGHLRDYHKEGRDQ